jgi:ubiquitin carboxyl-terminal hydrolase L5
VTRPADIRGSTNSLINTVLDVDTQARRPPKRRRTAYGSSSDTFDRAQRSKAKVTALPIDTLEETYHFISYIPAHGKVWELDGLKPGPLEVGELANLESTTADGWMDVVRPALRLKMKKYGGAAEGANIKFSLMALVHDRYHAVSDVLELAKRRRARLERRLDDEYLSDWRTEVRKSSYSWPFRR